MSKDFSHYALDCMGPTGILKVAFFRNYDAFFSLPQKCTKDYTGKEILKFLSVYSQLILNALQCQSAGKFKIQSLG